ncbi:roadblock/LC7 domain-containing protein [Myxococcota bacterium]|nr:roadblock/LC7 domain-containing protein [Myxococcota bacterium]MBU1899280.1 roadblock/LC7 domain-containing protein [Myxococcota bacterium]
MSRAQKLNSLLRRLQMESPDVEASALISEDSLIIASALPQHIDELRVAGMCATLLSLGSRASRELACGDLKQVLIRGDEGYVVMMTASRGTMLMVLTTHNAKLGLVFLDMTQTIEEINRLL